MSSVSLSESLYQCRLEDTPPPSHPRRSMSLQSIQQEISLGDMKLRNVYGPPADDDDSPFGLLFHIFPKDDIEPVRKRHTPISATAVFRLIYKRVGKINSGRKEEDFITLFHPLFLDEFERNGFREAAKSYGCFLGGDRFLITVFRCNHFFIVEARVVNGRAVFVVADSMGTGSDLFPVQTARKLSECLFWQHEYGSTWYPTTFKRQRRNDCGIHAVINTETLLAPNHFIGDVMFFVIKKNLLPVDVGALRDAYATELVEMLEEQDEAEKELEREKAKREASGKTNLKGLAGIVEKADDMSLEKFLAEGPTARNRVPAWFSRPAKTTFEGANAGASIGSSSKDIELKSTIPTKSSTWLTKETVKKAVARTSTIGKAIDGAAGKSTLSKVNKTPLWLTNETPKRVPESSSGSGAGPSNQRFAGFTEPPSGMARVMKAPAWLNDEAMKELQERSKDHPRAGPSNRANSGGHPEPFEWNFDKNSTTGSRFHPRYI